MFGINSDDSCAKKTCKIIKRLLLLVIPITIGLVFHYEVLSEYWIITLLSFINVLIVLWNVPGISLMIHSRSIYPDDLILTGPYDEQERYKFHRWWLIVNNCCLAVLTIACANYIFYKTTREQPPFMILGILGGIFSLYNKIVSRIGKGLLYVIHRFKETHEGSSRNLSPRLTPAPSESSIQLARPISEQATEINPV